MLFASGGAAATAASIRGAYPTAGINRYATPPSARPRSDDAVVSEDVGEHARVLQRHVGVHPAAGLAERPRERRAPSDRPRGGSVVRSQSAWMSGSGAGPWQVSVWIPPSRLSWLPSTDGPTRSL